MRPAGWASRMSSMSTSVAAESMYRPVWYHSIQRWQSSLQIEPQALSGGSSRCQSFYTSRYNNLTHRVISWLGGSSSTTVTWSCDNWNIITLLAMYARLYEVHMYHVHVHLYSCLVRFHVVTSINAVAALVRWFRCIEVDAVVLVD